MMTEADEARVASRRAVLWSLGLGGLAVAAGSSALSVNWGAAMSKKDAGWWDATFPTLRNGGIHQWSGLVGEWFYFKGGPGGFAAYMVREVEPMLSLGERPAEVTRKQAFAVTFQTSNVSRATAGNTVVEMTHPTYPALPVFVGSARRIGDKSMITAVFN